MVPGTSAENTQSPPKMTSPLGSAFSAVQPQMFTNGGTAQIIGGELKRKLTVDEQAAQLQAAQTQSQIGGEGQFNAITRAGFDFMGPSSCGEQMLMKNPQQLLSLPAGTLHPQQQMVTPIPFQHPYTPTHMHPSYTFSQDNMNFLHSTPQQQQLRAMMIPTPSNFFSGPFPMMAAQQHQAHLPGIRQPPHVSSPSTPITPMEKNAEIEMLTSRCIQSWTVMFRNIYSM